MQNFFQKINLNKTVVLKTKLKKDEVIERLTANTKQIYYSRAFSLFDLLLAKGNKFVGTISEDQFQVRSSFQFFTFYNPIKVNGNFQQKDDHVQLLLKIHTFQSFYLFTIIFLSIALLFILYSSNSKFYEYLSVSLL